jgi:hypothetical protein
MENHAANICNISSLQASTSLVKSTGPLSFASESPGQARKKLIKLALPHTK